MYNFLPVRQQCIFLLGNVFRENKNKLTVSHFIKVMEMQNIQLLELLILS